MFTAEFRMIFHSDAVSVLVLFFLSNHRVTFPVHFVPVGAMTTGLRGWCLDFSALGSKNTPDPVLGCALSGRNGNCLRVHCPATILMWNVIKQQRKM